jgi:GcrA cell cycle regulator
MEWTDEAIDLLRRRWDEGVSAANIAHELGMTKNAVLGKRHRLKLADRIEGQWTQDTKMRVESARQRTRKAPALRLVVSAGRLLEPLNIALMDLDATSCRFPTVERDGQQFFCGRPQAHDTSYCTDCCGIAFENYEDVKRAQVARLRRQANGYVAAPFSNRDYNVVGLVREVPFS